MCTCTCGYACVSQLNCYIIVYRIAWSNFVAIISELFLNGDAREGWGRERGRSVIIQRPSLHIEQWKITKAYSVSPKVQGFTPSFLLCTHIIVSKLLLITFRFGYVEFDSPQLAKKALEKMNGAELDGRQLRLDFAGPRGDSGGGRQGGDRWTPRGGGGRGTPRGGRGECVCVCVFGGKGECIYVGVSDLGKVVETTILHYIYM